MKKLIINADDFGLSHTVNQAITVCFEMNLIDKTSIMVNMPNADEAVTISKTHGFFNKVGLHLNLVEGKPLTEDIKRTRFCTNGFFNGSISKNRLMWFYLKKDEKKALKIEICAQINKYIDYGFTLKHIDSHQHSHIKPSIVNLVIKLSNKYKFKNIRLALMMPSSKTSFFTRIYKKLINYKIKSFNHIHNDSFLINVDLGDGLRGFEKELSVNNEKFIKNFVIETWVHPNLIKNQLVNDFYDGNMSFSQLLELKRRCTGNQ